MNTKLKDSFLTDQPLLRLMFRNLRVEIFFSTFFFKSTRMSYMWFFGLLCWNKGYICNYREYIQNSDRRHV